MQLKDLLPKDALLPFLQQYPNLFEVTLTGQYNRHTKPMFTFKVHANMTMNCCWQPQPLAVVAALGELRQVLAAVRAVVLAAVHQPLAVVAALEEVRQALALRAAMLAAVESWLHQALAWRRRKQLQHQPLAVQRLRLSPSGIPVGPAFSWSIDAIVTYLDAIALCHLASVIRESGLDGASFLQCAQEDLQAIGI